MSQIFNGSTILTKVFSALKYMLYFCLACLAVAITFQIFLANSKYRNCVILPSGLMIGYESMIAPRQYLLQPNVVLKTSDGSTLVDFNIETFNFTKTSIFGSIFENRKWLNIAYRPDLGLALEPGSYATYHRILAEAGQVIVEDKAWKNTNLLGAYYKLKEIPLYGRKWCDLPLISW